MNYIVKYAGLAEDRIPKIDESGVVVGGVDERGGDDSALTTPWNRFHQVCY